MRTQQSLPTNSRICKGYKHGRALTVLKRLQAKAKVLHQLELPWDASALVERKNVLARPGFDLCE
jgi:hypothetical protein